MNPVIANQILRIVAEKVNDNQDRLGTDQIDSEELARGFTNVWTKNLKIISEYNAGFLAYLWTNWTIWASKDSQIRNYLHEEVIEEGALFYLGNQHKAWGILWQSLWRCSTGNKKLAKSALNWLHIQWNDPSWSFVWQILLEHPDDLPVGISVKSLIETGIHWLSGREEKELLDFRLANSSRAPG